MGEITKIQWTDRTWNPWVGCTKVSEGCAHCYAEALDKRFHSGAHWGKGAARERTSKANWKLPHKWNRKAERSGKRIKVFCASMADWLDPEVPIEWFADLLGMIRQTPWLDWQLLTKRPELWGERLEGVKKHWMPDDAMCRFPRGGVHLLLGDWLNGKPPSNVWVGTSLESPKYNERIKHLLAIPAVVRFLSCEPLLGALSLPEATPNPFGYFGDGIHWVIVGGESGPRARECNLAWIEDIVKQCREAKVPVFVKQLGANVYGRDCQQIKLRDPKGGDMDEWTESLRVREFPVMEGRAE